MEHTAPAILEIGLLLVFAVAAGWLARKLGLPAVLGYLVVGLIVSPFTREHFQQGTETPPGMSKDPSLIAYDDLGGAIGQTIGFVEGREAAAPFAEPTPIDAINAALVDEIFYRPASQ